MTKVTEKIELSITSEEFMHNLLMNEEDREMLMANLVKRISREVYVILKTPGYFGITDFPKCFELTRELYEYGFREEAHALLTCIGSEIWETYSNNITNLMPYLLMMCKTYQEEIDQSKNYVIPPHWKAGIEQKNFFKGITVFIEDQREIHGIFYADIITDKEKDNEQRYSVAIASSDLLTFAQDAGFCIKVSDKSDTAGEHVQDEIDVPAFVIVEEETEKILREYIRAGQPLITLS